MLLKAKDYFTLGNAASGFLSTIFVLQHDLRWASYMILIAWFFDISDGIVARLTKQFNKFGAELDNVADLVAYSMAPSFLVYGFYTMHPKYPALPTWLAIVIASLPLLSGCVRFARFNVKRISYDGVWMGLPRPAAAFLFVGYINSTLVNQYEFLYWAGIFVVIYVSAMQFVLVPFCSNHWKKMPGYLKFSIFVVTSSTGLAVLSDLVSGTETPIAFDVIAIWLLLYLFVHRWLVFSPRERREIAAFVRDWKKDEAAADPTHS